MIKKLKHFFACMAFLLVGMVAFVACGAPAGALMETGEARDFLQQELNFDYIDSWQGIKVSTDMKISEKGYGSMRIRADMTFANGLWEAADALEMDFTISATGLGSETMKIFFDVSSDMAYVRVAGEKISTSTNMSELLGLTGDADELVVQPELQDDAFLDMAETFRTRDISGNRTEIIAKMKFEETLKEMYDDLAQELGVITGGSYEVRVRFDKDTNNVVGFSVVFKIKDALTTMSLAMHADEFKGSLTPPKTSDYTYVPGLFD